MSILSSRMELTESHRQSVLLILIILSLICLCSSFLLFVGAVNVKATLDSRIQLLETYNSKTIPGLFLFVGLINMIENGSCTFVSARLRDIQNREKMMRALIPVLIGGIVLVIIELSSTIASLVHMGILDREFGEGIVKAMELYVKGNEWKQEMDYVQTMFKCCGQMGYTDWFTHSWIDAGTLVTTHSKYLQNDGLYYSDDTPFSCCDKRSPRPCIHHHVHHNDHHHKYDPRSETTLYHEGCRKILSSIYGVILRDISIVSLLAAVLKIVIILLLRLIQTSLAMAQQRDDWEATTPAYIYFFKEPEEGEYKTVGDVSETDDEDEGTSGDETTVEGDEGEGGGDEEEGEGAGATGGGKDKNTSHDETDKNMGNAGDINVNFRRPQQLKNSERSSQIRETRFQSGGHVIPNEDLWLNDNNPDYYRGNKTMMKMKMEDNFQPLFERQFGTGKVARVDKSKMSRIASGMKEAFFRPMSGTRKKTDRIYPQYSYSKVKSHDVDHDLPYHGQSIYNKNVNKNHQDQPGGFTVIESNKARQRNFYWDFPQPYAQRAMSTPFPDKVSHSFADSFDDSCYNYPGEIDSIGCQGKIYNRTQSHHLSNESFEDYAESWRPLSMTQDENNSVVKHGTERTDGKIKPVNTMHSSSVNKGNNMHSIDVRGDNEPLKNASELGRLRGDMKTKSTENHSDKWWTLSEQHGTGADKGAAQLASHPVEDKLVDISTDVSNEPGSQHHKSIYDGGRHGNYYGPVHNSTGYSLKHTDNNNGDVRGLSSRVRTEINSKPDKHHQHFKTPSYLEINSGEEGTPDRLPPPFICETARHASQKQGITRPQAVMAATNVNLSTINIISDTQTCHSISKPTVDLFDPPTQSNCIDNPIRHPKYPSTINSTPPNALSSEYDLIPTIQRRGHDANMPAFPPEFSGDEVSPEVARINFPRALNMDCVVDIDSPSRFNPATCNPQPVTVIETTNTNQPKSPVKDEDGFKTPTSVSRTSSSSCSNLEATIINNQLDHTEVSQRRSTLPVTAYNNTPHQHSGHISLERAQFLNASDSYNEPISITGQNERRKHVRSNRHKNIFLASPISPSTLDISGSSADSKLYPVTSTPVNKTDTRSRRVRKINNNNDNIKKEFESWNTLEDIIHKKHQPILDAGASEHEHQLNTIHLNVSSKFAENLIDLSDTSREDETTVQQNNEPKERSMTLISPFY